MNDNNLTQSPSTSKLWTVGTLTYGTAGIASLFFWLLWGDFAWSMKERAVTSVATLMIKSFEVSDFTYGLLILAFPNCTNVILGPFVSYYSDRHRSRFGRRIPFLAFTLPFIIAGMVGLALTPKLGENLQQLVGGEVISRNAACLLCFSVFWILFDFGNSLANTIFTALVNDVVPVKFLGRFFGLFRAISLGAGIFFNYCLMGQAETHATTIFLGLAALYFVGFSTLLVKVKEGEYPSVEKEKDKPAGGIFILRTYIKECFSTSYYRILLCAVPLAGLANIPFNAYSIFQAKSLGVSMDSYGKYLAYTYAISFVLSYFLGSLADKFHPIRMGIFTTVLYGILSFVGYFYIDSASGFAIVLILHGVLSGCFMTTTASFGPRLFPKALFAQFYSAMWILQSMSWVIMAPLIGKMLDYTNNQYKYTLLMGGIFSILGTFALCIVYRWFQHLGGDSNYKAPEVAAN